MTLSHTIKRSAADVFSYLADMQKLAVVHPVITNIERNPGDSYKVYETLKILSMPISFTYFVTVRSHPADNKVVMHATVKRSTVIDMTFVLKMADGLTIVEEDIQIRSTLPIVFMLKRIFKKQHQQLFKNIETAI